VSDFVHRAFFYNDENEWLDALLPFVQDAIVADEPILVAVTSDRTAMLRNALGDQNGAHVEFAPMESIGKNPGRIISAWHDFVGRHPSDRRLRGVGEPVWPGRRPDELIEHQLHEHLLNLAFEGHAFELMCPYDRSALPAEVLHEAARAHPFTGCGTEHQQNPSFQLDPHHRAPLSPPPDTARSMEFNLVTMRLLRQFVTQQAAAVLHDQRRLNDLVLAISEAVTNSVQYGGGGVLSLWTEPDRLICEITDGGQLTDPLVGRRRPPLSAARGRGVWMVHQICDLVQIRSTDGRTTVRMAMEFDAA
jgi:anti-sigma regulatory factor (Ser/Thr protein kinase)